MQEDPRFYSCQWFSTLKKTNEDKQCNKMYSVMTAITDRQKLDYHSIKDHGLCVAHKNLEKQPISDGGGGDNYNKGIQCVGIKGVTGIPYKDCTVRGFHRIWEPAHASNDLPYYNWDWGVNGRCHNCENDIIQSSHSRSRPNSTVGPHFFPKTNSRKSKSVKKKITKGRGKKRPPRRSEPPANPRRCRKCWSCRQKRKIPCERWEEVSDDESDEAAGFPFLKPAPGIIDLDDDLVAPPIPPAAPPIPPAAPEGRRNNFLERWYGGPPAPPPNPTVDCSICWREFEPDRENGQNGPCVKRVKRLRTKTCEAYVCDSCYMGRSNEGYFFKFPWDWCPGCKPLRDEEEEAMQRRRSQSRRRRFL